MLCHCDADVFIVMICRITLLSYTDFSAMRYLPLPFRNTLAGFFGLFQYSQPANCLSEWDKLPRSCNQEAGFSCFTSLKKTQ